MSLMYKKWRFSDENYLNNKSIPIRYLFVNGNEKYRLEVNGDLKYAKGKIEFDFNLPFDGSNNQIPLVDDSGWREGLYCFYGDSQFYYSVKDNSGNDTLKDVGSELSRIYLSIYFSNIETYKNWATFEGWYLKKDWKTKIESVYNITNNTNLFKYKSSTSIPTVTLYARWTVKTFTVTAKVIEQKGWSYAGKREYSSKSSYYDEKGIKRSTDKVFKNVKIGTEIISMINEKVKKPTYCSWITKNYQEEMQTASSSWSFKGCLKLSDKEKEKFSKGEYQPFYGWYLFDDGAGRIRKTWILNEKDKAEIDVWPQFQLLIVWLNVYSISKTTSMTNHRLLTCPVTYTHQAFLKDVEKMSSIPNPDLYTKWNRYGYRSHIFGEWLYSGRAYPYNYNFSFSATDTIPPDNPDSWIRSGVSRTIVIPWRNRGFSQEKK